jgi:hypothetical protein
MLSGEHHSMMPKTRVPLSPSGTPSLQGQREILHPQSRMLRGDSESSTTTDSHHQLLTPLAWTVFNTTLQHVQRCSALLLELPASYTALAHRIPSLGNAGAFVAEKKSNVNGRHAACRKTQGAHRDYIIQKAALEMVLYEAVFDKTKEKLAVRYNSHYFLQHCFHKKHPRHHHIHYHDHTDAHSSDSSGETNDVASSSIPSRQNPNIEILPPVIVTMNSQIHQQLKAMLTSITRKPIASLIDVQVAKSVKPSPPPKSTAGLSQQHKSSSSSSNFSPSSADNIFGLDAQALQSLLSTSHHRGNVSSASTCAYDSDFSLAIVDAAYFKLLDRSKASYPTATITQQNGAIDRGREAKVTSRDEGFTHDSRILTNHDENDKYYFDRKFFMSPTQTISSTASNSSLQDHSWCSPMNLVNNHSDAFSRMAVIVKDPFVQIFLQAFGGSSSNGPSMFDEDSEAAAFPKEAPTDTLRLNETLTTWLAKQQSWKWSSSSSLSSSSQSTSMVNSVRRRELKASPSSSYNNKKSSYSDSTLQSSSGVNSRRSGGHERIGSHMKQQQQKDSSFSSKSTNSIASSASNLHDKLISMQGTSSASLVSGNSAGRLNINLEPSQELPKYQALYSLLFTETEYVSLFQSKQQSTALKTFPAQDFQFFAYEALIDEAFQHQMKMLLVDYQEVDALMEFYRIKRYPSEKADEKRSGGKEKEIKAKLEVMSTQSSIWSKLLVFTQQWTADHLMTHRLRCAFGSAAHWIHPDLVMRIIPSVKLFYAEHPLIFERVKPIVRQAVEAIGLDPEQMHFMYKF